MATRQGDGSIRMSDGRVVYANSIILAQDLAELIGLFSPPPAWPFVSGGGGGGGGNGVVGRNGAQGAQGPSGDFGGPQGNQGGQGFQGDGVQGAQGNQGVVGAGVQGPQGFQGLQGPQGNQGIQGTQGNQGNEGNQGFQGTNPGPQGNQGFQGAGGGPQGAQGDFGPQGFQGTNPGVQGPQGSQGFQGTGPQGAQGNQGNQGPLGSAVQNTIIQSQVVGQNADFFSVAGLTLTVLASASNPFGYDINGQIFTRTSNLSAVFADNANNFVWIDDTQSLGASALPPIYSFVAPGAPAVDQHWFNLGLNHMQRWNGAAWVSVNRIFIGYIRADGGNINPRYVCEPLMLPPMQRFLTRGTGTDGFLELTAGTTTLDGGKNYTAVVLRGTAIVKHTANAATQMNWGVQGIMILIGTAAIDLNDLGGPRGTDGPVAGGNGGLGGAGGGGSHGTAQSSPGGNHYALPVSFAERGGGAISPADNVPGGTGEDSAIPAEGLLLPVAFNLYGGGGGNAAHGGGIPAVSSPGGGGIQIECAALAIGSTAIFRANTSNGTNGIGSGNGGGSTGGGGVLAVFARSFWNDGASFTATPGAVGGEGGGSGGPGGLGGQGRAFWRKY